MDEITKTSTVDSGIRSSTHDTGGIGKVLLRWMWLPIFGSVIGATVGVAYFVQLPKQYKATAQVQVVSPPTEILISNRTNNIDASSDVELAVIKSDAVLRNAVEQIELTKNRNKDSESAVAIVGMLQDPKRKMLEVRLSSKDVNSKIVNISVTTKDAKLSAEMVTAIVNGYEKHVSEKFSSTVTRLEVPTIGSFSGPYWTTFFWIGAILGFVVFCFTMISGAPEFLRRKLKPHTTLAAANSNSYRYNRANLTRAPLT